MNVRALTLPMFLLLAPPVTLGGCAPPDEPQETSAPVDPCSSDGMTYLVYGCRRGTDAQSEDYVKTTTAGRSFEEWKVERCLDGQEDTLQYFNLADLALGRELHATTCGDTIAAYVLNFGEAGQSSSEGLHAIDVGTTNVAVAMDYQPPPKRRSGYEVQFYVFVDGHPATGLQFDREGFKRSPFACTVCHGGRYDEDEHLVKDAFFLPLLAEALTLRSVKVKDEEKRRRVNVLVRGAAEGKNGARERPAKGILDVLDAAYPAGVTTLNADYVDGAVPPAWSATDADRTLYSTLLRPHCSMCHAAQLTIPFDAPGSPAQASVKKMVCVDKLMPQALEGRKRIEADQAALDLACKGENP